VIRLVDSHCHLDFKDYDPDRDAVVEEAKQAGVDRIITIGTDLESLRKNAELVAKYPNVWQAVGLHPTDFSEFFGEETIEQVREAAKGERVVAIGECGLDYLRVKDDDEKDRQRELFRAQLELAAELDLPISLHTREAEGDTEKILKAHKEDSGKQLRGVGHCFTSSIDLARQLLDRGFYISFSGIITFKNSDHVREVAKFVPLDRMMVETDAPFLRPEPERGKRNEPAFTLAVAETIAHLKGISLDKVAEQTTRNAEALFGLTG
jgi:TatD DNase family protein